MIEYIYIFYTEVTSKIFKEMVKENEKKLNKKIPNQGERVKK